MRQGRAVLVAAVLVVAAMATGIGIVQGAVAGDFSATFDGYDDAESTTEPGHEIKVTGTLEVRGSSAVNPVITIVAADQTVLDTDSVEIAVLGGRSLEIDRTYRPGEVTFRTDEIPAGTELELRFLVYPVGGTMSREVDVATVRVRYKTESGVSQTERFRVSAILEDSADRVIDRLRSNQGRSGGIVGLLINGLALIGLLLLILIPAYLIFQSRRSKPPGT